MAIVPAISDPARSARFRWLAAPPACRPSGSGRRLRRFQGQCGHVTAHLVALWQGVVRAFAGNQLAPHWPKPLPSARPGCSASGAAIPRVVYKPLRYTHQTLGALTRAGFSGCAISLSAAFPGLVPTLGRSGALVWAVHPRPGRRSRCLVLSDACGSPAPEVDWAAGGMQLLFIRQDGGLR